LTPDASFSLTAAAVKHRLRDCNSTGFHRSADDLGVPTFAELARLLHRDPSALATMLDRYSLPPQGHP
jgi:hypothetical protein